ncbi:MFS general substrate transporter [Lipomyces starkeyi]
MTDLIREAPLGQIIRYVSGNKLFLYQDEKPDFRCPNSYAHPETGKYFVSIPLFTQFVAERFGVSTIAASLGLSAYVIAYGIGPLIFAPLSEIPALGHNVPYMVTFALFVVLTVPTALTSVSLFGKWRCLYARHLFATQASIRVDIWVSAAYCGPALGSLLSGFAVPAENRRWSLWEILWMSGPVFLLFFICLPETSASNILLRPAQSLKSQSEIDQANMKVSTIAFEALIKPWQISILDPAVAFTHIYTSIVYGIYYSYFEVFPLVYIIIYGMNLGEMGLVFLVVLIACIIAAHRLVPALFAVFGPPIGLFLYGWTSRESIHWVVPTIGILIYAANDFCRSAFASGSIIFARPMYLNLGIGKGISLLGGLSVLGIIGMYILYFYGANLRARSKFALG